MKDVAFTDPGRPWPTMSGRIRDRSPRIVAPIAETHKVRSDAGTEMEVSPNI